MNTLRPSRCLVLATLIGSLAAQASQHLVVPPSHQATDAIGQIWVAGANNPVRQMTLIAQGHLQAMVGHDLLALELRRSAANEVFQGGVAHLSIGLSTSPNTPLTASRDFAANIGANAIQAWTGAVSLPTSPPTAGPAVSWATQNIVRIAFQTPFRYDGGTLCVDITGLPIAGQTTDWWMADAEFESLAGTVTQVGNGCGAFGGGQGLWSYSDEHTLLPGAYAHFSAHGMPAGFGIAAFGAASQSPIPLAAFGLNAPGCNMHINPNLVLATVVAMFVPETIPQLQSRGGSADIFLRIPNAPWVFGLTLTTQWIDLAQVATSNALQWTIANALPSLGMAVLEGEAGAASGLLSVHRAHVMRFEYR